MKKWNIIFLLLVSVLILGTTIQLPADDYSNFQGRAISLKVLQQQARDFQNKGSMPTTLYYLCGITTIHGYLVDEANKDIILIGSVDKKKPPLYLDDFVIALRNAWMKYTELIGNTNYYSNPGCSIDPDPAVMGKIDEITKQIRESSSNDQANVLRQWDNVCKSPQKVRVMGVPFNSHFAWVMVNADYDMKKIVDGTDELNLLWFSSLSDLIMNEVKTVHIHGRASSGANGSMNRFWFYPGEYRFLEDDGAVMIETCNVKLLTEEEHLTSNGDISGTGCPNPIAETFVKDFSTFYHEIAAQRPIYQELENLFRFVALAKAMKMKAPHEKVGLSLDYLLEQYPVSTQRVENSLPGRSNVNYYKRQRESAQGTQLLQLWLPSCGGVAIPIQANSQNITKVKNDKIENIKAYAISGVGLENKLFCDFTADADEVYIVIKRKFEQLDKKNGDCTLGEVYINGNYEGRSLELPYRMGKNDISSIPPGTYDACLRMRDHPDNPWRIQLKQAIVVPNPSNPLKPFVRGPIQAHPGTIPKDTKGCPVFAPGPPFEPKTTTCNLGDFKKSSEHFDKIVKDYFGSSEYPNTNIKIILTIQEDYNN